MTKSAMTEQDRIAGIKEIVQKAKEIGVQVFILMHNNTNPWDADEDDFANDEILSTAARHEHG